MSSLSPNSLLVHKEKSQHLYFSLRDPICLFSTKSDIIPYLFMVHSAPSPQTALPSSNTANMSQVMALIFCLDCSSSIKQLHKWTFTSDLLIRAFITGYSLEQQILCPTPLYSMYLLIAFIFLYNIYVYLVCYIFAYVCTDLFITVCLPQNRRFMRSKILFWSLLSPQHQEWILIITGAQLIPVEQMDEQSLQFSFGFQCVPFSALVG